MSIHAKLAQQQGAVISKGVDSNLHKIYKGKKQYHQEDKMLKDKVV